MYAETKHEHFLAFNCVQRAHQNVVENLPVFLSLLFASVYRPLAAAIAGLIRVLGFVAYVHFYSSGDPAKRQYGSFGNIGMLIMLGLTFEAAYRLISA
ncbi:hypothetical protein DYB32_004755 [Aphanomyces invadans]|uniref:MAPEG family protein n=1 Tax=Aphanomyces invadans TaxID=157072 RepID=A0A418AWU7_9STRA|nr:hypothetical protein DYB32_004755 [Aphanomyces invadans]